MRVVSAFILSLFLVGLAVGDDQVKSGPQPKEEIPATFQPFIITGKERHKNKFHCPVSEYGFNPTVMILVRGTDPTPAVLSLLKQLDEAAAKNERWRLSAFVVFLADDITDVVKEDDKREAAVAKIADKVADLKLVTVALDGYAGVKELFKLDDKAEVTVVIYNKLKVLDNFVFAKDAFDDKGVAAVMEKVNARIKEIREEVQGKPRG